jgi:hypothetical protein
MTIVVDLFENLLRDYGFLAAMVRNLDAAREVWARQLAIPSIGINQRGLHSAFSDAYSLGTDQLRARTPMFLYGMCLVHAYGLLEHFLTETIRQIVQQNPRILLTNPSREDKKVEYKLIINNLHSPATLLDALINRELLKLTYGSTHDLLAALRDRFTLATLDTGYDARIVQLSLIRNCLVHNRGRADARLAAASNNFYREDELIYVDRNMVSRSITTFSRFAAEVDRTRERLHSV